MKIDKFLTNLSKKLDDVAVATGSVAAGGGDSNPNPSNNGIDKHDDEYYMDILDTTPTRFVLYRHVRMEKWVASGHEPFSCSEYDNSITQDELDYYLKWRLRISPEQRYQRAKNGHVFHGKEGPFRHGYGDGRDGWCNPECKYYPEYGRIEDEEVIADHNEWVESCRQKNAIVEPPSHSELLELINSEGFAWLKNNCS